MWHIGKGKTTSNMALCRQASKTPRGGKKIEHYSDLPKRAIDSIINVKEEKDIDSLSSAGKHLL